MEEKKADTPPAPKPNPPREESQGVIVEIFKKLLQYNFTTYGTKKDF